MWIGIQLGHNGVVTVKNWRIYNEKHLDPARNCHLPRLTTERVSKTSLAFLCISELKKEQFKSTINTQTENE